MSSPADSLPQGSGSHVRDHLANERTFLSWTRLGLSSMGFGFVVARFGLFLRLAAAKRTVTTGHLTDWIGFALVLLGPVILLSSGLRYLHTQKNIEAGRYDKPTVLIMAVTGVATALGFALAAYLLVSSNH